MAFRRRDLVWRDANMRMYFRPSKEGIVEYALRSDELGDALAQIARSTTRYAVSISPTGSVDEGHPGRPHYRNSWHHEAYIERETGDPPFPRQAQRVYNDAPHATIVEFGSGRGTSETSYYGHRIFPQLFDFIEGQR